MPNPGTGGENGFYGVFDLRISKKFAFNKKKQQGIEINYGVNTAGIVTPSGDPYQAQIGFRYIF